MDDKTQNDATDPDLISAYSRSEALADGLLVDVTETAREAGFLYPVALTRAAWELCVALGPPAKRAGNDEHGRFYAEHPTMLTFRREGAFDRDVSNGRFALSRGPEMVTAAGGPGDSRQRGHR